MLSGLLAKTAKSRCQGPVRNNNGSITMAAMKGSVSRGWEKDVYRSCKEGISQHLEMYCEFRTPSIESWVVFSHITVEAFSLWAENGIRDDKFFRSSRARRRPVVRKTLFPLFPRASWSGARISNPNPRRRHQSDSLLLRRRIFRSSVQSSPSSPTRQSFVPLPTWLPLTFPATSKLLSNSL